MNEKYIQILGLSLTFFYAAFVVFLYAAEPRSLEDISTKARQTVDSAVTKGQVIAGSYAVDQTRFNEGLNAFRQDNFIAARDLFERSDPERRDARVQYYIAYSFYRQGWGRVSNDDALFKQALEKLDRVTTVDPNYRSDDPDLRLRTPAELKHELEEGLTVSADDFNPLRLVRERQ